MQLNTHATYDTQQTHDLTHRHSMSSSVGLVSLKVTHTPQASTRRPVRKVAVARRGRMSAT